MPNSVIDNQMAHEVSSEEKQRVWENITKFLWADFLHKLDDLCEIMVENGVSDIKFKGAVRMAARLRYDEWKKD